MFTIILTLRCENYAISMLEQCENLNEVELFLETKTSDGKQHKDANYILAILDSRKKFVAHERFQYVLLKKFGETDQQVNTFLFCYNKIPSHTKSFFASKTHSDLKKYTTFIHSSWRYGAINLFVVIF